MVLPQLPFHRRTDGSREVWDIAKMDAEPEWMSSSGVSMG